MNNISFDNPWLLLVGVVLLLAVVIPFIIAIRRENRNAHNVTAFVLHLLIVLAVTLGLAGMTWDAMITETEVYVLADVSYSSNNNLDVLDGYVRAVEKNLPKNTQMSVIAFGRNYQMLSDLGEKVVSVRQATEVDAGATDIAGALRYAGNLFVNDDVIKRIVVITDGKETAGNTKLTSVVTNLKEKDIYIDVVYLNNNITDAGSGKEIKELQVTDVSYTASAFVGKTEQAQLQIDSNNEEQTRIYVDVEWDNQTVSYPHIVGKGQNLISVPLNTQSAGTFHYTITVRPENAAMDTSPYNNTCLVTQRVSQEVNVLFLGGTPSDCLAGRTIYGRENVTYISDPNAAPFTAEDLCVYDEIVLCNFDVRTMANSEQFISSLETAVSKFGKTLTTFGNTFIQDNETDKNESLIGLSGMLPVNVGNSDKDGRLMVILMDISSSTNFSGRLAVAREAAVKLIETMEETDRVMILGFSGDVIYVQTETPVSNKEKIINAIDSYQCRNGTYPEGGLERVKDTILGQNYHRREVVVISDAIFPSTTDADACIAMAEELSRENVVVSALGVFEPYDSSSLLEKMVTNSEANGKGYYKSIEKSTDVDYVIAEIVEEMQEVRIEGDSYKLTLNRPQEDVLQGVGALPAINGFWYSTGKTGATAVVTAAYQREKGTWFDVPVYFYWGYGSGRVASFMSDITANWLSGWDLSIAESNESRFLKNIRTDMLPDERINSPLLISTETNGSVTTVKVSTSTFRSDATLKLTIKDPNGSMQTKTMYYDTENYVCQFETDAVGYYSLHLEYDYVTLHYVADHNFQISYYQEYNAFETYNVASLYRIISENGEVSLDGELAMDNSDSNTRSYTFSFVVPLMVFSVVLFVLDIIIRMLRWKDVRSLFTHGKRRRANAEEADT